jgi:cobalt-zinc-cadmium efflux system outer membrane protein
MRALAGLLGDDGGAYALSDADAFGSPPNVVLDPTETLDVKLAELELAAARARVDVERTGRVPDLTVEGGVRHFRGSGDTAFVAGVSMPIPIRNRNQGSIAAAQAEATGAEARRNLALAHATRAIRDAQAALAAADSRLKTLRDFSLPQSEEAVRLARLGYQEGEFNLLDVLDAEEALAQARQGLIDAELTRAKALAALERAAAQ